MVSLDLSAASPMAFVSTPSIATEPPSQSTIRNNTCMRVLLPLPVRPTMPIFSPGLAQSVHRGFRVFISWAGFGVSYQGRGGVVLLFAGERVSMV